MGIWLRESYLLQRKVFYSTLIVYRRDCHWLRCWLTPSMIECGVGRHALDHVVVRQSGQVTNSAAYLVARQMPFGS